jgi:hypothetical protein
MTSFKQSKRLAVVAACIWATALATGPATAQQPDSATINGTIGSSVYGAHTWTLTLQGLSYSYDYWYSSESDWRYITRVSATSFDFQFQGPHAAELNANVSQPLVNGELQDGPVVVLENYAYWEADLGYIDYGRNLYINVTASDYQQGLAFGSSSFDWSLFETGAGVSPVLAPFTSLNARTILIDNRNGPGSGYTMGIMDGTVSVSSVGFSLPGDYTRDGVIDAADYVVWRDTHDTPDGYNTWRSNFGRTSGAGAAMGAASNITAPEPGSIGLFALAVPALLRRRPRAVTLTNSEK